MKYSILFILLTSTSILAQTCPPEEHWVRAHKRRAHYRLDGVFVRESNVKSHCQKNSLSFSVWNPRFKPGIPNEWPHKAERPKEWTDSEKERLLEAFDELPESLWSSSIKGLFRMDRSATPANPATSSNGLVVFYDSAFEGPMKNRPLARILAHELAHQIYLDLSESDRNTYIEKTGWVTVSDTVSNNRNEDLHFPREKGFVEPDGELSPEEDFANNIEYYLINRTELKSKTPAADQWIEKHFGDKFKLRKVK